MALKRRRSKTRARPGVRRAAIRTSGGQSVRLANRSEFLDALAGTRDLGSVVIWPEKKKVEKWVEPEGFRPPKLGSVIEIIRREKKKYELELAIDPRLDRARFAAAATKLAQQIESQIRIR